MPHAPEPIIIGIDPGTQITGYGIIQITKTAVRTLDFGCIRPPAKAKLSDRYYIIFQAIQGLLSRYNPVEMAIETQFFRLNAQSALKLSIAQGVAIIAAKEKQLKVFPYSPREVKCAIVGTGKATKEQMQGAVARYLQLKELPTPYDAADALAIALCHTTGRQRSLNRSKEM